MGRKLFFATMKSSVIVLLFVSLLFPVAPASADTLHTALASVMPEISTSFMGMEFANVDGQSLKLDLYVPSGSGPFPVIVSIHGGSWTSGTRDQGFAVLQVQRGYAVANIDYRLAPDSHYPAQIEDCKAAIRWLRANAARFNLNPKAFGVMGYSAGGHLAALVGTVSDVPELEGDSEGNPGVSSRVQAVVDYFGPTDLLQIEAQAPSCLDGNADDPSAPPSLLIGCPIQTCREATEKANPIRYVTPDDPPFMILHGLSDCLVPWQQSQILYDALQARGVESKLILVPFAQHADPMFLLPTYMDRVNSFLDSHLKTPPIVRRRAVRR